MSSGMCYRWYAYQEHDPKCWPRGVLIKNMTPSDGPGKFKSSKIADEVTIFPDRLTSIFPDKGSKIREREKDGRLCRHKRFWITWILLNPISERIFQYTKFI